MAAADESSAPPASRPVVWVNGPIVVGAGPAGLSVAACLRARGVPCVVLDRADCIASLWQHRTYERLRLQLPRHFCELHGMPFSVHYPEYRTKRQFVDYLNAYAEQAGVQPRFYQAVTSAHYDAAAGFWRVRAAADDVLAELDAALRGDRSSSRTPGEGPPWWISARSPGSAPDTYRSCRRSRGCSAAAPSSSTAARRCRRRHTGHRIQQPQSMLFVGLLVN